MLADQLPIVRMLAQKMQKRLPPSIDLEDLISAGTIGLLDAVARFDPAQNVQFQSYARFRIQGAMTDSLRLLDWSPRRLRRKGRKVEDAIRSLTARLCRTPDEDEVAVELGLELLQFQRLRAELNSLSVDTLGPAHEEEDGEDWMERIPGVLGDDPLVHCLKGELKNRLAAHIAQLPERERLLVTLYYFEEMNLSEIALILGVKQSRVFQIHNSAVCRLQSAFLGRRYRTGTRRTHRRFETDEYRLPN